jgi:FlaA1/EpsC-like NDP-sugar epimerase
LFLSDFAVVFCAIGLAGVGFRLFGPLNIGLIRAIEMALGFAALFSLAGMALDTNRINWRKATLGASGRLWLSWLVATAVVLVLHYNLGVGGVDIVGVLVPVALVSLAGIMVIRYRERLVSGVISRIATRRLTTRAARERVLVVGSGRTAEHIAWLMEHPAYLGKFQIVGFIDDDLRAQGMKIYGARVIGRTGDIERIAKERDVGLIILADNQIAAHNFKEFREITRFNPARVVVAPDIFGSLSGLDAASQGDRTPRSLHQFQCQHCLARYSDHRPPLPRAVLKKPV